MKIVQFLLSVVALSVIAHARPLSETSVELFSHTERTDRQIDKNEITYRGRLRAIETTFITAADHQGVTRLVVIIQQAGDCHLDGCRPDLSLKADLTYVLYDSNGVAGQTQRPRMKIGSQIKSAMEDLKLGAPVTLRLDEEGLIQGYLRSIR